MTNKNIKRLLITSIIIAVIAVFYTPNIAQAEIPFSNDEEKKIWMNKLAAERTALEVKKNNDSVASMAPMIALSESYLSPDVRIQQINDEFARVSEELRALIDITEDEKAKLVEARIKVSEIKWLEFRAMSIDVSNKVLDIKLALHHNSQEFHITQYLKNVIDVPFVLSFGAPGELDSCDSNTSDCDPIIGGLEFHTPKGTCTIGLPAKMNHKDGVKTGFITAGHCVKKGDPFQQPSTSETNDGFVVKVIKRSNCDCAFIETNSSDFSSKVYKPSGAYSITTRADPKLHDFVRMEGITSGEKLGQVTNTNVWWVYLGTWFSEVIEISNFQSQKGDSGAPIIDNGNAQTFHGTVTGHGWGNTYAMKWSNIDKYLDLQ